MSQNIFEKKNIKHTNPVKQSLPSGMEKRTKNTKTIFGRPLSELMTKSVHFNIPLIVYKCIQYLIPNYLQTEGIFRRSGNRKTIQSLKFAIDSGNICYDKLFKSVDCYDVCDLLKHFFQELPEPVINEKIQSELLLIFTNPSLKDAPAKISLMKDLFKAQLHSNELQLLSCLCTMLNEFGSQSEYNKMSPSNLACVWAPNIIWSRAPSDPMVLLQKIKSYTPLVEFLIIESRSIFEHPNIFKQSESLPSNDNRNKENIDDSNLDMMDFSNLGSKVYRKSMPPLGTKTYSSFGNISRRKEVLWEVSWLV
eukprot:TRINITY_DN4746_c0_g1_i1.p1 TRINITY_DN4746_c0_g1~~TRINITY_DN4746_c0_g1_i1.p1  ORF type:complete len:308 (+),score=53.01 TRINITY_DN4746_c0_g1_i1:120-1043(+)